MAFRTDPEQLEAGPTLRVARRATLGLCGRTLQLTEG